MREYVGGVMVGVLFLVLCNTALSVCLFITIGIALDHLYL